MVENYENNLGFSLVRSACSEKAVSIATDIADFFINRNVANEILKDLPFFGLYVKLFSFTASVHDYLFLRKVQFFLNSLDDVSNSEKKQFLNRIEKDLNFCNELGENLILILDRLDNIQKSQIIGKIFAAYIRQEIDYETFLQISRAIDLTPISNLKKLNTYYKDIKSYKQNSNKPFNTILDDYTAQTLYAAGLLTSEGYAENIYRENVIGSYIIKYMQK